MLRDLQALTPKAIARLGRLIEDPNPAVSLGAVKEVLDRNLGKVKQQVQVDVTSTHVLHLQALETLAQRKREAQLIEAKANATLYVEGLRSPDVIEAEVIEPENASGAAGAPRHPDPEGAAAAAPTPPPTHEKSPTDEK